MKNVLLVIATLVVVLAFVGFTIYFAGEQEQKRNNRMFQLGYDSRKSGVSDLGNPYTSAIDRVYWLEGWRKANEEKGAK